MSHLIHRIAIETSGGECLAKTKEHLFRAAASMSEECNRMRTWHCGEKSKRGSVCSQHYFFDADARLDRARKYGANNQDDDGRRNDPTGSASTHDFMLARLRSQISRIITSWLFQRFAAV
jgi:hypothetical protein